MDLRSRFEAPNEKNRWDCPLFNVINNSKENIIDEVASSTYSLALDQTKTLNVDNLADGITATAAATTTTTTTTTTSPDAVVTSPHVTTATAPKSSFVSSWKSKPKVSRSASSSSAAASAAAISASPADTSFNTTAAAVSDADTSPVPVTAVHTTVSAATGLASGSANPTSTSLTFSGSYAIYSTLSSTTTQRWSFQEACEKVHLYFLGANIPTPNISTISIPHTNPTALYELDQVTQKIVTMIEKHQEENKLLHSSVPIIFSEFDRSLFLYRLVSSLELQRSVCCVICTVQLACPLFLLILRGWGNVIYFIFAFC